MKEREPFLTYFFQGFKFEFIHDEVYVTDITYRRKYRIQFPGYMHNPFLISLVDSNIQVS